jgi:hypothetical protein
MGKREANTFYIVSCRLRPDQVAVLRQISRAIGMPVSEQGRRIDQWLEQYADRIRPAAAWNREPR